MPDNDEYKGYNEGQKQALMASGNVLVSASAGSGKTTVMAEKVFRLVKSGADIRRMVVMTFTRAAAAEIKNRVLKKLYSALRSDEAGDHIRKQIEAFPFTNISTIDSFCFNIIKRYFGVIGADPSSKPYEEDEANRLIVECIDKVCEEKLEAEDPDFIAFATRYAYKRSLDSVKELILKLHRFASGQPEGVKIFQEDKEKAIEDYFISYAKKLVKEQIICGNNAIIALHQADMTEFEKKASVMYNNLVILNDAEDAAAFFNAFKFMTADEKATTKSKGLDILARDLYNAFVRGYNSFYNTVAPYANAFFGKVGRQFAKKDSKILIELTLLADKLYTEGKRRDKKLDFADMGNLALRILEDPSVRQEVRDSFDYIFVDEYQDTNYIQESLLDAISTGNNVYVVGDVKQAIYQFRTAEPEIFRSRKRRFDSSDDGQNVKLNENYRSGQKILDFVNDVCSEVMTEDYCGIDYRADGIMEAHDKFEDCGVEIYTVPRRPAEKKVPIKGVYSVKEAEVVISDDEQAEFVADYIQKNVGKTNVYRIKEKRNDVLKYNDVAVLVRANTQGVRIAEKLASYGIPYNIDKVDEGVDVDRELLIDFIRICYGNDDLAVLNVMMSPLFLFTAKELASIRALVPKTPLLEAVKQYNDEPNLQLKAKKFVEYVEELRAGSAILKVSEILTKVLADGLEGHFISKGGDVAVRIKKFVSTVKSGDCDGDIADFLNFCEKYKGERPPAKKDSVTIVTVHKSKGLEFPFVIIPYLEYHSGQHPSNNFGSDVHVSYLSLDRDLGVSLTDSDDETGYAGDSFGTLVHKLKKRREERKELARLMYVAFTRAENRLVLIGDERKACTSIEMANSFSAFISYAEQKNPSISKYRMEYPEPTEEESFPEIEEDVEADFSYVFTPYAHADAVGMPAKTTVSEVIAQEEGETRIYATDRFDGGSSAILGTAYHLIMQKIDFSTKSTDEISAFVSDLVAAGEIGEEVAKEIDVNKRKKLLDFDVISGAVGKKTYREMPFLMPYGQEGGLIQGVVDLLIEEEDGFIVVDYKASSAGPDALKARYAGQLDLYAQAAERILKKPVKEKILLNLLRSYEVKI